MVGSLVISFNEENVSVGEFTLSFMKEQAKKSPGALSGTAKNKRIELAQFDHKQIAIDG